MLIQGQVAVINLPRRKDRLEAVKRQLDSFELVEAIDGKYVPDLHIPNPTDKPYISGFERACIRSHKKAVQGITGDYITVLEDDFLVMPNFDQTILEKLPSDWRLFYWGHVPQTEFEFVDTGVTQIAKSFGAWAYTIKWDAVQEILDFDEKSPFDMQMNNIQGRYGLADGMIGVSKGYSDIKGQEYNPVGYYLKDNVDYGNAK